MKLTDLSKPQANTRVVRVFISSTFMDMQAERDILIKKVFPQLRRLCEERAVSWAEVDLRWGITSEEASEGKVLPLCLAEIQRCRPYFIGLLGERYGWIPEDREISADLLESQPWLREHREHSVTELEILHGVLRDPAMADRSLFYFRDPGYFQHLPEDVNPDHFAVESPTAAIKLANLKERIRAEHTAGRLLYQPREGYPDPEALGEMVLADFAEIIEKMYPKETIPDPLDQEALRHAAYADSRRTAFVGRDDLLRQIDEHMNNSGQKPLVVSGASGCGKSALLAEWAAHWRRRYPDDLIIEHYVGSTPDSADWQGIVRRILGELKRALAMVDEVPLEADSLRSALQDWLTRAVGERRIIVVLDGLNQLSGEDPAAHQLGWFPVVFPANVKVLISSLPGESLEAVRRRNWPELRVPLFQNADIVPAAQTYCALFAKKLPREVLSALENTPAATNPLYLRCVLDELRQFGKHQELVARAYEYLSAHDLPELFDLILDRWHDDFGREKEHPDLVHRTLCLIGCTRFGLSEAELLDLLGKDGEQLPHRYWTPLYLAVETAMANRAGLFTFGHDFLRAAVHRRWLNQDDAALSFRLYLADYFGKDQEPGNRKLDELPVLLRDTAQWERLKAFVADPTTFLRLRGQQRWKWELQRYWRALENRFDPAMTYLETLRAAGPASGAERMAYLFGEVATFHLDAARYSAAEPLLRQALEIRERVLGPNDPNTLSSVGTLAWLLQRKGDYASAEPLCRRALEGEAMILGWQHPNMLTGLNNLAEVLFRKGDYEQAEGLFRRALELRQTALGAHHPDTLQSMNNLALFLSSKGDYQGAESMLQQAVEKCKQALGPGHPETITSMSNLAILLKNRGAYAEAEELYSEALKSSEELLGPEHPETVGTLNNLALLLRERGEHEKAEPLLRRAQAAFERLFGPDHPDAISGLNNLGSLLEDKGDYEGAESLYRRALEAQERVLGPDHPTTLNTMSNLALNLQKKRAYAESEQLCRHVLEARERVLGPDHPETILSANNLAFLLMLKEDHQGAETLFFRAFDTYVRVLGPLHPNTLTSLANYALLLEKKGNSAKAEEVYGHVLESREEVLGEEHPDTITTMNKLAFFRYSAGDLEGAEQYFRRQLIALVKISGRRGQNHPELQDAAGSYVELLMQMGQSKDEAVQKLQQVLREFGWSAS